ncbi:MAG: isoaspartyl peptidase/L-asparaginase, partial [Actinomycetota bacterium]
MAKARILVHGGAGLVDEQRLPSCILGCEAAALVGQRYLGDSALQAVVAAVKSLEENPAFNAGLGSTLTREGTVEL